ncbi:hypothetical protein Tco_0084506 [Tanacetum coccineum]
MDNLVNFDGMLNYGGILARRYGYIKNHKKTVKNGQARTRESEKYKRSQRIQSRSQKSQASVEPTSVKKRPQKAQVLKPNFVLISLLKKQPMSHHGLPAGNTCVECAHYRDPTADNNSSMIKESYGEMIE